MSSLRVLVPVAAYAVSSLAFAHVGHAHDAGLAGGFAHPFVGLDHLLAAIAVGLWAATQAGAARWIAPGLFLGGMCGGIALGRAMGVPPLLEIGIAGSVLAIGAMILVTRRIPDAAAVTVFALFGLLHGMAHGAEAPAGAAIGTFAFYVGGLLAGTAMLHAVGIAGGTAVQRYAQRLWPVVGAALALTGAALLAA